MPENLTNIIGYIIYTVIGIVALWGAFCVVMVWLRVGAKRFRSEEQQQLFLDTIEEPLMEGDFDGVGEICHRDPRALCQIVQLGVINRQLGYSKVKQMVLDRFERDVLADLDYRLTWVKTVIAAAPMIGLLGTVVGMMGAFEKLSTAASVDPTELASSISLALITTALGLTVAIPLVIATASLNNRIRKMEDLVSLGLGQFLDTFREALSRHK